MEPVAVLFFGPQGSGKGTQVQLLIEDLKRRDPARKIIHMDMGQMLRDLGEEGSYTSKIVHETLLEGALVPDFIPTYLMSKALIEQFTGDEHIIADGVSRRPGQTHAFDDMMIFARHPHYQIVDLHLSEEESIKRLLKRGRSDDTEEAIKRRLQWHHEEVEPLLDLLKGRGRTTHRINGDQSVEAVHADIMKAIGLLS